MSSLFPAHRLLLAAAALLLGMAVGAPAAHAQTANLQVTSSVVGQCTVTGGTLAFGTYVQGQTTPKDGQGSISLNCPAGINVTVNMNMGLNPGSGSRNMASAGNFLNYQLFRDAARSQVWGTGTGASGGKPVNPTSAGAQAHDVYGQIGAAQAPSTTGNYTDTVVVGLTINS
jgi:spore coat protein U-like protein